MEPRLWPGDLGKDVANTQSGKVDVGPRVRADSNARRPKCLLQISDGGSARITRQSVGKRQLQRSRPVANALIIAGKFIKRMMAHTRIEPAISAESIPPEHLIVKARGSDKYGGRKRTLNQFVHTLANRTTVNVRGSECYRP